MLKRLSCLLNVSLSIARSGRREMIHTSCTITSLAEQKLLHLEVITGFYNSKQGVFCIFLAFHETAEYKRQGDNRATS